MTSPKTSGSCRQLVIVTGAHSARTSGLTARLSSRSRCASNRPGVDSGAGLVLSVMFTRWSLPVGLVGVPWRLHQVLHSDTEMYRELWGRIEVGRNSPVQGGSGACVRYVCYRSRRRICIARYPL